MPRATDSSTLYGHSSNLAWSLDGPSLPAQEAIPKGLSNRDVQAVVTVSALNLARITGRTLLSLHLSYSGWIKLFEIASAMWPAFLLKSHVCHCLHMMLTKPELTPHQSRQKRIFKHEILCARQAQKPLLNDESPTLTP